MFRGHERVRIGEESNSPSDCPPEPEVTVCGVESSLVQVTMSPVLISRVWSERCVSQARGAGRLRLCAEVELAKRAKNNKSSQQVACRNSCYNGFVHCRH